jgi:hydrogenase expression/formation protein HypE
LTDKIENQSTNNLGTACPTPIYTNDVIRLGHGSGGRLSSDLLKDIFLPALGNEILNTLDDASLIQVNNTPLAITVDSYVINPIFFPGGDIGSLSVYGTVNDLSMRGATPICISGTFILEEGFPIEDLHKIVVSMRQACLQANVQFVAGDTKVVNRGAADKVFITTCGLGLVQHSPPPSANRAMIGDKIIVSGDIGRHGTAVMCARESFELETTIESDSAPLNHLVQQMLTGFPSIHCLRDITRGGLASILNELAGASKVGMEIEENSIPVDAQVASVCALLGLDPLYVACEGRLVAIVPEAEAEGLLDNMHKHPLGKTAQIIGKISEQYPERVVLKSRIGGHRILDKLAGEQLPRIC